MGIDSRGGGDGRDTPSEGSETKTSPVERYTPWRETAPPLGGMTRTESRAAMAEMLPWRGRRRHQPPERLTESPEPRPESDKRHLERLDVIVDRPAFHDHTRAPHYVPDRYGRPLDRPDGARTPLFDGTPTREQAEQGVLNDCGVIAALGAVAGHRPDTIRHAVRERDDGNYEVRLHETRWNPTLSRYEPTGQRITMTVTPDLPISDATPHEPMFAKAAGGAWAPIMEKAIAGLDQTWSDERRLEWDDQWAGEAAREGISPSPLPDGYVRLNKGTLPSDQAELLTQLTGDPALVRRFADNDAQILADLRAQLDAGSPVLVGTRHRRADEPLFAKKLEELHVYEVTDVDDQGRIHLRNPWGDTDPPPLSIDEFRGHVRPDYATMDGPDDRE